MGCSKPQRFADRDRDIGWSHSCVLVAAQSPRCVRARPVCPPCGWRSTTVACCMWVASAAPRLGKGARSLRHGASHSCVSLSRSMLLRVLLSPAMAQSCAARRPL